MYDFLKKILFNIFHSSAASSSAALASSIASKGLYRPSDSGSISPTSIHHISILSSTSCLYSCSSSSSLLSPSVRNYSSSCSSSLYGREEETQQHCKAYKEDKAASH